MDLTQERDPSVSEIYQKICDDIYAQGYSIIDNALPQALLQSLMNHIATLSSQEFKVAGTGRQDEHQVNQFVRRDEIHWLSEERECEREWFHWAQGLQTEINKRLMLGLFSYEAHMAHYEPGAFYKKHLDAFKGSRSRVLSTVLYLNPQWQSNYGGELVIYDEHNHDSELTRVSPMPGTLVVFLSEDFPHEVLPAREHRHSIAGWFRVNESVGNQIAPPQ
ncbi:2OG-Fe(II) oxygenase [Bermanella marisrubri]|uniref:Oxidoreductase, 2OG-Fe(II) oxygenase family protein n=1 Tax=Bermanella marisrubri TaxID=207949 RepID=Q1MZY2_9GAMM|nr:2OG-Fe(II) oxygenase [Bermanella marisrubri]EAT11581.1 oxidoreductase, 2OG-Fe(II) oxygenase family protein [Oceanobacter sp. RED65] [Bermanella marisrubri]QIZ84957.1 2OG-Fe(II) oxygenase [Bermanella marisrubri]